MQATAAVLHALALRALFWRALRAPGQQTARFRPQVLRASWTFTAGMSLILFGLAILFVRRELRPVMKLGMIAEALGKGRDVPDFRPEGSLESACHLDELVDVDAGLKAHRLQHRQGVFATQVAAGARGKRAAADPTDRSLEETYACLQRRQEVCHGRAASVVEVQLEAHCGKILLQLFAQRGNLARIRDTDRVTDLDARKADLRSSFYKMRIGIDVHAAAPPAPATTSVPPAADKKEEPVPAVE